MWLERKASNKIYCEVLFYVIFITVSKQKKPYKKEYNFACIRKSLWVSHMKAITWLSAVWVNTFLKYT